MIEMPTQMPAAIAVTPIDVRAINAPVAQIAPQRFATAGSLSPASSPPQ